MITVFILSLSIIIYAYVGYPISLFIFNIFNRKSHIKKEIYPNVTYIVTLYNEEKYVSTKINNTLALLYPKDKLQIIFVSDGSNDQTDNIISQYVDKGIEYKRINIRKGKEYAQKTAIKCAKGDILVFSDAKILLEPNGLKNIVSNFYDKNIGCVSSEDRLYENHGRTSGESLYVRYEMWIRRLESEVNSIVGLSGSFFAVRKNICNDFDEYLDSDFNTLLNTISNGLRGISDPETIGCYYGISDHKKEYHRKIRTVLRGITVLFKNIKYLNVFRYKLFSYQLFCHKLLRWIVPFALIILCLSTVYLSYYYNEFKILLFIMCIILLIYILEAINILKNVPKILRILLYFITVNLSIIIAWFKYFKGERMIIWEPTERQ